MKVALLLSLSLMFALSAFVVAKHNCDFEPTDDPDADYVKYQKCHQPDYKRDEKHEERVKQFHKCHKHIKDHSKAKAGHKVGFTQFCHWTDEEIDGISNKKLDELKHFVSNNQTAPTFYSRQALTGNWSWVDYGAVTSVKNQGACGSCYTFAAAAAIEGAYFIKTGRAYNFSTQQYVDCSYGYGISYNYTLQCEGYTCWWVGYPVANKTGNSNRGCNGGDYTVTWTYNQQVSPLVTWECYPYTSGTTRTNGTCAIPNCAVTVSPGPFVVLPRKNETALQYAVRYIGPVACAIDASSIKQYTGGIVSNTSTTISHAITVVGYATTPQGDDYWIIKNSWGTFWGDKGYLYLRRNVNALNIGYYCAYPTMV